MAASREYEEESTVNPLQGIEEETVESGRKGEGEVGKEGGGDVGGESEGPVLSPRKEGDGVRSVKEIEEEKEKEEKEEAKKQTKAVAQSLGKAGFATLMGTPSYLYGLAYWHALVEELSVSAKSGDVVSSPFEDDPPSLLRKTTIGISLSSMVLMFCCVVVGWASVPLGDGDGVCFGRKDSDGTFSSHLCASGTKMDDWAKVVVGVEGGETCPVRGLVSVGGEGLNCGLMLSLPTSEGSDVAGAFPTDAVKVRSKSNTSECTITKKHRNDLYSWMPRVAGSVHVPTSQAGYLDQYSLAKGCREKRVVECGEAAEASSQPVLYQFDRTFRSGMNSVLALVVVFFLLDIYRHVEAYYPSNACCETTAKEFRDEDGNFPKDKMCLYALSPPPGTGYPKAFCFYLWCCCVRRCNYMLVACCANNFSRTLAVDADGTTVVRFRRDRNKCRAGAFAIARRVFNFFALVSLTQVHLHQCETSFRIIAFSIHDTLANQLVELLLNIPLLYYLGILTIICGTLMVLFGVCCTTIGCKCDDDDDDRCRYPLTICCYGGVLTVISGAIWVWWSILCLVGLILLIFSMPFRSVLGFFGFTLGWVGTLSDVYDASSFFIASAQFLAILRMVFLEVPSLLPVAVSAAELVGLYSVGATLQLWSLMRYSCNRFRKICCCIPFYVSPIREPPCSPSRPQMFVSSNRVVSYTSTRAKSWRWDMFWDYSLTAARYDVARAMYRSDIEEAFEKHGVRGVLGLSSSYKPIDFIGEYSVRTIPEPLDKSDSHQYLPSRNPKYNTIADVALQSRRFGDLPTPPIEGTPTRRPSRHHLEVPLPEETKASRTTTGIVAARTSTPPSSPPSPSSQEHEPDLEDVSLQMTPAEIERLAEAIAEAVVNEIERHLRQRRQRNLQEAFDANYATETERLNHITTDEFGGARERGEEV